MVKKLLATQGSDEVNDGTRRFPVERDGTVDLPDDVADRALHGGGFVEVAEPATAPDGWVTLTHPTATGCSYAGVSYPSKEGAFTVPAVAVEDLASHGFAPVGETVEQVVARHAGRVSSQPDAGLAIMRGQPGQGASYDGQSFTADGEGLMLVPVAAVEALLSHGFTVAPSLPPEEPETPAEEPAPEAPAEEPETPAEA